MAVRTPGPRIKYNSVAGYAPLHDESAVRSTTPKRLRVRVGHRNWTVDYHLGPTRKSEEVVGYNDLGRCEAHEMLVVALTTSGV